MTTEKLKPCPYCKGKIEIHKWQGNDWSFFCENTRDKCGHEFNVENCTREEAIKMHNTRAEDPRIKELEAERDSWKLEFEHRKYAIQERHKQVLELVDRTEELEKEKAELIELIDEYYKTGDYVLTLHNLRKKLKG